MPHELEGFDLSFTHRRSWKAYLVQRGQPTQVIPVTWGEHMRPEPATKAVYLPVWFQNPVEMESVRLAGEPFIVATARAKPQEPDYEGRPQFDEFTGVFRVIPTGEHEDVNCIWTRVLERLRA